MKIKVITCIFITLLLLTGCSSDDYSSDIEKKEKSEKEKKVIVEETKSLTVDKETAKGLKQNKEIKDITIQLEETTKKKYVNADIELKKKLDGKEIAKKYENILKEKYPDRIIDIIVIYDGKILEQTTF